MFGDTSFFTDWVAGDNPGLFLRNYRPLATTEERLITFFSRNWGRVEARPELIVSYTPVPLPAGFWLLASALLGLAAARRSNMQARQVTSD